MMRRIIGVFVFILGALSCANAQFQIRFIKDRVYDEMAVYQMLKMYDPAGLESRAGSMDIDLSLAEIIHNSKNIFTAISMTNKIVSVRYKQHSDEIDKSKKEYSSSWKLMINDFSTQIQRITEHKWFYPEYICVVSPINTGVSNWYVNKIIRHSNENPIAQRRITAHEIVLSHIFRICRAYYNKKQIDDWHTWAIAEITAVLVLDNSSLLKYWANYSPTDNYFSRSNYPQLAGLEKKLREYYSDKTSFKEYIDKAVAYSLESNRE